MSNIIDLKQHFEGMTFINRLSKMIEMIEEREEKILKDPLPFLKEMSESIGECRECLRNIDRALSPLPTIYSEGDPIEPVDICSEVYKRNQEAQKILDEFLR